MLIVDDCIISDDIATAVFCCSLRHCKGMCCVEGDAGAPLEKDEIAILQSILSEVEPFMTPEGIEAVKAHGVAVNDPDGQPVTPLVNNRECAFAVWHDGMALCAIEKAYLQHKTPFRKPLSCHLYPIRVDDYGEFRAVNFHRWSVCTPSLSAADADKTPLYIMLKEPLIRKFGQEWYNQLLAQIESIRQV